MADLIDRAEAIEAINQICPIETEYDCTLLDRVDVRCVLTELPSAQPQTSAERRGRWIERNPLESEVCRLIGCSECGKSYIVPFNVPYKDWAEAHKYCVECGAKMEAKE